MTMGEGLLPDDALHGRAAVGVVSLRLPWYRSLPKSCLEAVEVSIDGSSAVEVDPHLMVAGFDDQLSRAASGAMWWDLRDRLDVQLIRSVAPGSRHTVTAAVTLRIPYLRIAPGTPYVRRTQATRVLVAG